MKNTVVKFFAMFPDSHSYLSNFAAELEYLHTGFINGDEIGTINVIRNAKKAWSKIAKKYEKSSPHYTTAQAIVMVMLRTVHIYDTSGMDGIIKEMDRVEAEMLSLRNQSQNAM